MIDISSQRSMICQLSWYIVESMKTDTVFINQI
jgi:hypothetical protein